MIRVMILFFTVTINAVMLWPQENQVTQDPVAGQVLERVANKIQSLKSIQADFVMVISDRKENTESASSGTLIIKQHKYRINSEGSTVYFDGKTMWTYLSASNEVTVSEPEMQADDFMTNPAVFFSVYKRDFKFRYVRAYTFNGSKCHEIDLFPKNLQQPYSRIKVVVGTRSDLPEIITSVGKDGIDYTVKLSNLLLDRDVSDATFTFDPSKYKKLEIIDMRGTE